MVRTPHAQTDDGPGGDPSPRERIVAAALACMERDGIEATGIRAIAREAGVNSAAINYYFRSKENLIGIALERSLENAFGEIISELDRLRGEGLDLRQALTHVIDDYALHMRDFPRIAYAHLREALVNQRYDGRAIQRLNQFLDELLARLVPGASAARAAEVRLVLVQKWSALVLLGLLPRLFEPFLPLDFADARSRERFVRELLRPLLDVMEGSS
jgi:AcrR family transcriptional regulator